MRWSIRYEILAFVMALVGISVVSYLLFVTHYFEEDRIALAFDAVTSSAHAKAREVEAYFSTVETTLRLATAAEKAQLDDVLVDASTILALEVRDRDGVAIRRWVRDLHALPVSKEEIESVLARPVAERHWVTRGLLVENQPGSLEQPLLRLTSSQTTADQLVLALASPSHVLSLIGGPSVDEASIVDASGRVIVHPDLKRMLEVHSMADSPLVAAAFSDATDRGVLEFHGQDGSTLGAFARVAPGRLAVIAQVSRETALRSVEELNRRSLAFGAFVFFFALLASIFAAKRITGPIRRLQQSTQRIAAGDFDASVPESGANELQRLGGAFNTMAAELKSRERTVKEAYGRMLHQDRMVKLGTMAASVGHEINNPLTFISANLGCVEVSLRHVRRVLEEKAPEISSELRAELDDVLDAHGEMTEGAERIGAIVRDMKLYTQRQQGEKEIVDLRRTIESALKMSRFEFRAHARVEKHLEPVQGVLGQSSRLGQVFMNLIVNAAQALREDPKRTGPGKIEVSLRQRGSTVIAQIRDDGPGVPADVAGRIFEPFVSTKGDQGTGLGLSICREIIEECGGTIELLTTDAGTAFEIRLPASAASEPTGERRVEAPLGSLRVLAIDDEAAVLASIERLLRRQHEVVTVRSGHDALSLLESDQAFDCVLCDVHMPQMSGEEVYRTVVALNPSLARRFVFISGHSFLGEQEEFVREARLNFVPKPFDGKALNRALSTASVTR